MRCHTDNAYTLQHLAIAYSTMLRLQVACKASPLSMSACYSIPPLEQHTFLYMRYWILYMKPTLCSHNVTDTTAVLHVLGLECNAFCPEHNPSKFGVRAFLLLYRCSAYESSMEALQQPSIRVIAVIAEGVPEADTKQLIAYAARHNKIVLGPATVGGLQVHCMLQPTHSASPDSRNVCTFFSIFRIGSMQSSCSAQLNWSCSSMAHRQQRQSSQISVQQKSFACQIAGSCCTQRSGKASSAYGHASHKRLLLLCLVPFSSLPSFE